MHETELKTGTVLQAERTIYRLRHTAICMIPVLSEGKVNVFTLAKNAGTNANLRSYPRNRTKNVISGPAGTIRSEEPLLNYNLIEERTFRIMKNVVFVDFQAKRHEREEGFLIWKDMVERRARLFSEIRENDGQVVTPWDAINLATRKRGPPC